MSQTTDFLAARAATEKAAADLFGAGSSKAVSVSEAWQAVGVGGPAPQRIEEPTPEDPGPDNPDDGTGGGGGGGGGNGGGDGTQAGTGTVTGGCSTGGTGSSTAFSLLVLLGLAGLLRRKED